MRNQSHLDEAHFRNIIKMSLETLHQIHTYSPHTCPLSIKVHRNGEEQTGHLDTADSDENVFATVSFEPAREEEGEDKAVEDI
jgi:hypothetical protein